MYKKNNKEYIIVFIRNAYIVFTITAGGYPSFASNKEKFLSSQLLGILGGGGNTYLFILTPSILLQTCPAVFFIIFSQEYQ